MYILYQKYQINNDIMIHITMQMFKQMDKVNKNKIMNDNK